MKNGSNHISAEMAQSALRYFQGFMPEFTATDLQAILQYCLVRKFPRKAKLVEEGEVDDYLNLVLSGLVRKYVRSNTKEQTLQLATEGHLVHSELSFLTRQPSLAVLETLEPTLLLSLRFDKMEEALEHFPQGERMGRLMLTAMYIKKDERRYARASKTVRELFMDYVAHHPHMLQRVPQKYLASYLNIKPETFSRLKHLGRKPQKINGSSKRT
jgi:CRP-like cAMP-binding protein